MCPWKSGNSGRTFLEVISPIQKTILHHFGNTPDSEQFYLTGGTALAYFYLKHRKSNDLDFFTSIPEIITPFSHQLEATLKGQEMSVERRRGFHSFVEFFVKKEKEATIVQLALDSAFRFDQTVEFPEYPHLKVDSLVDIASNKLLALFGRAALRDFIDVYSLVKKELFTLDDLMDKAKKKDLGFDLYWLGIAFERIKTFDQNSTEMLLLMEPLDFRDLVAFFDHWLEKIIKKIKGS